MQHCWSAVSNPTLTPTLPPAPSLTPSPILTVADPLPHPLHAPPPVDPHFIHGQQMAGGDGGTPKCEAHGLPRCQPHCFIGRATCAVAG